MENKQKEPWFHKIEWSAVLTVIGVIILFSGSVIVTLIAPSLIDPSWTQASSLYQAQMYLQSDPYVYIAKADPLGETLQYVYHLRNEKSLLAFSESSTIKIIPASKELEKYITKESEPILKLTNRLLLLKQYAGEDVKNKQTEFQEEWKKQHAQSQVIPHFQILELYEPTSSEVFAITETDGVLENWIDKSFTINDNSSQDSKGSIYIHNPKEFKISQEIFQGQKYWKYDPQGKSIDNLAELTNALGFLSRKELISMGENIYKIEGCWYCHTDQTRTLIQDTVLNGSASFPAPPSSANEYIFESVTFPGTRRIGPDLSREGIKKPSRDWHKSHFWSPKTESPGTIMPSFRHFFDNDPRGTSKNPSGIPNYRFEAIYQYLMTKGTRITSPNQAWWLGKDPIHTIKIIEGRS